MVTKYIISIKHNPDTIIDDVFNNKMYIYRYRSNYEYAETCFKRCEAKTFATRSAAEKAAIRLVEIYDHFKGYEIIEIKKKI
jgi:CTP synthase (UTP-ammonia lyase)